ncbi:MAG: efflux RND transporter periplasmic adaptor subunit [Kiritimatiellae bacterium]|nr:efflux RND transporter periplasmic adaptor subunit [Kiritimatiellia bacterium]
MSTKKLTDIVVGLKRWWRAIAGIIGLVVVIMWTGGACGERVGPGRVEREAGIAVPADAPTCTVKSEEVAPRIDVIGTLASELKIHLSARISAYVKEVFVSAGSRVKAGQPLVTLDSREIQEQLAAAEAQLKQAETEFNRTRQLLEKNATTEQALTAAETLFNSARAQVEQVRVMVTYTAITSPIDGIVTHRRIEAGDLANHGQVLLSVYDPARMRLEAPVPMRLVERLELDQDVEVELDRPAGTYRGRVAEIVSEVDPLSRTQLVKVRLEELPGGALPGTFGRLWVEEAPRPALLVPRTAVYRVGQLEVVQLVRDGRAHRRLVRTGAAHGDRVEILSGLQAGDVVLVNPGMEG